MRSDGRIYWIWLAELLGQGSRLAAKLVNLYGDALRVYETPTEEICRREDFTPEERRGLKRALATRDTWPAERIFNECQRLKIRIATPESPEYPGSLRALTDMPLVLYYYGTLPNREERLHVSVVGTRKMTEYGRKIAYSLGYGLGVGGAVLVSGMALGTDSMAMVGALDSGADVVAVLGCGVERVYPKEHRDLYNRIIGQGAVISEYPPGSEPAGHHFPVRNRIISGLSEGTVVVEGGITSGALITARHAAAQGKTVFAVPGKVGEVSSEGPLHLLHEGALPVSEAADVLAEFAFLYPQTINLDFGRSRLRQADFETESKRAMRESHIGVRGDVETNGARSSAERAKPAVGGTKEKKTSNVPAVNRQSGAVTDAVKKREWTGKSSNFPETKHRPTENPEKMGTTSEEKSNFTTGFALNMLDETDWKVYNIMQQNVPVVADDLVRDGLHVSDVMSALSTLELAGLVESAVGGYFIRLPESISPSLTDDKENGVE